MTLSADTCTSSATLSLRNQRSDMRRYEDYYCNVAFFVPERIVLPAIRIVSLGENITSIRAGSMDKDTPDFGLDLGPNQFTIEGEYLDVRLRNISTKELRVRLDHGNFFGEDLGLMSAIANAVFYSKTANLIATTTNPTSMRYWQKSDNKVCITGANGSVYLRDACEVSCSLIDASGPDGPQKILAEDLSLIHI